MTRNNKPRKPGRTARANQRLSPIEQAVVHRARVLAEIAA